MKETPKIPRVTKATAQAQGNRYKSKVEDAPENTPEPTIAPPEHQKKNHWLTLLNVLASERFLKVTGILLMAIGLFTFLAIISHFFSGTIDQDLAEAGPAGNGRAMADNLLGSLGAWIAHLFVSDGLGFIAITIPLWLTLTGYAMLEPRFFGFAFLLFRYNLLLWLWVPLTFGWIAHVFNLSSPDWGGAVGLWMVESLALFIGNTGVGILIVSSLLIILVILYNFDVRPGTWLPHADAPEAESLTEEDSKDEMVETHQLKKDKKPQRISDEEISEDEDPEDDEVIFEVEYPKEEPTIEAETPSALQADPDNSNEFTFEVKPGQKPDAKPTGEVEFTIEKPVGEPIDNDRLDDHSNIMITDDNRVEKIIPEADIDKSGEMDTVVDWTLFDPTLELQNYKYPTIDLLNHQPATASPELERQELVANKEKIERTLRNYGIEIVSIKATVGPTVTLYEIVPAPGIKISRIRNLEDDIALSLAALGIRIIAPIPGKGTIGIEIPNSHPEMVTFRSVIGTEKFRDSKAELPIAIGKTITNEVYIADLAKMPHLLIAGATGQGKSVGLNNIIASILYKRHPSQVKFVLIDPKKVEMPLYQPIENHFLAKLPNYEDAIITDSKQVIHVLNSLCIEMDSRYDLLKMAHTRNITEYNKKFTERRLNPLRGHKYLPYIVLVIDELADLMMTAGKEVETPIARLAQLARAVGIHLVVATQRPSVNVITGIIKANFPTRISYKVSSKIDSRTILDQGGADKLIGKGDLLLSTGSDIIRIQNAFIDTPEVEKLVHFISDQVAYPEPYYLPEVIDDKDKEDDEDALDMGERDRMFEDAARLIVRHQMGSTSLIQRRLKLGYNRAGRIMDQLERSGVVGPTNGSKPRDVLIHTEPDLERFLSRNDEKL